MKIKNFLIIFTLFMVLLCGASAVSAASDNTVDNLTSDMDDSFLVSNNLNAVGVDESASVAQENDDGLLGQSQNVISDNIENQNLKSSDVNTTRIYVGQNISEDGGNGSYENPFSSLKLACDNINGEDTVILNIFNGTYYIGSELVFNTNNLIINGINGDVIIKNEFNTRNVKQAFELKSALSNCTMNNIIFDGTNWTIGFNNRFFFHSILW